MFEFLLPLLQAALSAHGASPAAIQAATDVGQLAVDHGTAQSQQLAGKDQQISALTDELATLKRMIDLQAKVRAMFPQAIAPAAGTTVAAPAPGGE